MSVLERNKDFLACLSVEKLRDVCILSESYAIDGCDNIATTHLAALTVERTACYNFCHAHAFACVSTVEEESELCCSIVVRCCRTAIAATSV